ncbi:MAG TPA: LpqB family beta-propeller domain-containing protein [Dehalococcoidia bacterium]|nr:LpqB family beta-propeller domain-containing protein [Dehalococcoidia bacterium]
MWPFARGRSAHDRGWGALASAYVDRELAGAEADAFAEHLRACGRCAALVAEYRSLDADLRRRLVSAPAVAARPIFERAERLGPRPVPVAAPRRLALASAAVLLVGGAATPPVRAGVGGAVQFVRSVVAPSEGVSYAGDRAIFHAGSDDILASVVREYTLYTAPDTAAAPAAVGSAPFHDGPIFALAGGRVLFNAAQGAGPAQWTTVRRDGSDPRPFFPTSGTGHIPDPGGLSAVSTTPDGSRVLFRRGGAGGRFLTTAGATLVTDADGSPIWSDPGGADVYSLSPDGRFALSGQTGGLRLIPLDGSAAPPSPISDCDVQRPQISADGTRLIFVATRVGPDCPATSALYFFRLTGAVGSPYLEPVPLQDGAAYSLSPDGQYVAVQSWLNEPAAGQQGSGTTALKLWNLSSGERQEIPGFRDVRVLQLSWSADGSRLLIRDEREGRKEAWAGDPRGRLGQVLAGTAIAAAAFYPDGAGMVVASDGGAPAGIVALGPAATQDNATGLLANADGLAPAFAAHGDAVALLRRGAPSTLLARHGHAPAGIGDDLSGFSWAPDGRRAAVVVDGRIYLWTAHNGRAAAPLLSGRAVAWSPRDDQLLVTRGDGSIVITDVRGQLVAAAPAGMTAAAWSPDGRLVAGVAHAGGGETLVIWEPSSGAIRQLASAVRIGAPVWSPDGRSIAYAAIAGAASGNDLPGLNVVAAAGGEPRQLAALAAIDDAPVWSADSHGLYYLQRSVAGAPGAVRLVNADGNGDRRVGTLFATALFAGPR